MESFNTQLSLSRRSLCGVIQFASPVVANLFCQMVYEKNSFPANVLMKILITDQI